MSAIEEVSFAATYTYTIDAVNFNGDWLPQPTDWRGYALGSPGDSFFGGYVTAADIPQFLADPLATVEPGGAFFKPGTLQDPNFYQVTWNYQFTTAQLISNSNENDLRGSDLLDYLNTVIGFGQGQVPVIQANVSAPMIVTAAEALGDFNALAAIVAPNGYSISGVPGESYQLVPVTSGAGIELDVTDTAGTIAAGFDGILGAAKGYGNFSIVKFVVQDTAANISTNIGEIVSKYSELPTQPNRFGSLIPSQTTNFGTTDQIFIDMTPTDDQPLTLTVADYTEIENMSALTRQSIHAAFNIVDTAANIEGLLVSDIDTFSQNGVLQITSTGPGPLDLTVDQFKGLSEAGTTVVAAVGIEIVDTAASLETLSAATIATWTGIGLTHYVSTDGDVAFDVDQAEALIAGAATVSATGGEPLISDTADNIEALTPAEISNDTGFSLETVGFREIDSSDASIALTADQALALEQAGIRVAAPDGEVVFISDTAANIEALTSDELTGLKDIGVGEIDASDASVFLSVAQALALEGVGIAVTAPQAEIVAIADTPDEIATLAATDIQSLPDIGISEIQSTNGTFYLDVAQTLAVEQASIKLSASDTFGLPLDVVLDDTAVNIETLQPGAIFSNDVEDLASSGITMIESPTSLTLSVDQVAAIEQAGVGLAVDSGSAAILDTATQIETLTADEIDGLVDLGISQIQANDDSVALDVAQAEALAAAGVSVSAPQGDAVYISDTAANIDALDPGAIYSLDGHDFALVGVIEIDSDGSVVVDAAQAVALAHAQIPIVAPAGDTVILSDMADNIEALTPTEIASLDFLTGMVATDASVRLDLEQAGALESAGIPVSVPAGETVTLLATVAEVDAFSDKIPDFSNIGISGLTIDDAAANIETLSSQQIDALVGSHVQGIESNDASLTFDIGQEAALVEDNIPLAVPDGDTITLTDTAAAIETLAVQDIVQMKDDGFTNIDATDGSLQFDAAQAVALEDPVVLAVPSGDSVSLVDTASDLAALTPQQIAALGNIQFTGLTSTDASLQFDVAQALAIEQAHLTLTVPPGDAVTIADTAANIATLTTQDYAALAALGVTNFTTEAPCYCPGTLIRTDCGEVPIETLAIGDMVMTMSGQARPIRWIGRRSYSGRFAQGCGNILPVCVKAGALGESIPRRDLWISPHHAMYLEGVLIEAKDLVNGVSIVQAERVEKVEYIHIELDTHDVIIAEGAPSESFIDDDSRGMFHNAHEYRARYSDAPQMPAPYCAPRLDDGYQVEAARQRIDGRAGLRANDDTQVQGLRGYLDQVNRRHIAGWAQNPSCREAPVCLDIFAEGRLIGQTLANCYREDLERAGFGSGRHGFQFTPPAGLAFAPHRVEVRRSLDGAVLEQATAGDLNAA